MPGDSGEERRRADGGKEAAPQSRDKQHVETPQVVPASSSPSEQGSEPVPEPVLVSACLLGVRCRYDGGSKRHDEIVGRLSGLAAVPVCPEQLGGLPTPRPPCEVRRTGGGMGTGEDVLEGRARVVSEDGEDETEAFLRGARETLRIAGLSGARRAMLKTDSPSCDPTRGVTAAVLGREGLVLEAAE